MDRGLGLEKGVGEEAARTKEMSSGGRGRGAEMRWSTCAHIMETPFSPNPMSQLDVGGKMHTCKAAFLRGNTINMQIWEILEQETSLELYLI